jgi:hypothetical protein
MIWQILRRVYGAALMISSMLIFAWGVAPVKLSSQSIPIFEKELRPETSKTAEDELPVALLRYEWPEKLRMGDAGKTRLTFEWIEPEVDDLIVDGLTLSSQLDLVGIPHTPSGEISQVLVSEHPVVFLWSLRTARPGEYLGKLWLHLQSLPVAAGRVSRRLLAARSLEIRVDSMMGLNGDQARVFGMTGMIVGILVGFHDALLRMFIQLWRRFYA